jgi:hypothetical protein
MIPKTVYFLGWENFWSNYFSWFPNVNILTKVMFNLGMSTLDKLWIAVGWLASLDRSLSEMTCNTASAIRTQTTGFFTSIGASQSKTRRLLNLSKESTEWPLVELVFSRAFSEVPAAAFARPTADCVQPLACRARVDLNFGQAAVGRASTVLHPLSVCGTIQRLPRFHA